jgi:hypothetical protein
MNPDPLAADVFNDAQKQTQSQAAWQFQCCERTGCIAESLFRRSYRQGTQSLRHNNMTLQ